MITIQNIQKLIGATLLNGFQIHSIDADINMYLFNVERIERLYTTQRVIQTNIRLARAADKAQRYILSTGDGRILWIDFESIKNISIFTDTLNELLNLK